MDMGEARNPPPAPTRTMVSSMAGATQPDLVLAVRYEERDRTVLTFRLEVLNPHLGLVHEEHLPHELPKEALTHIRALFKLIGDWPLRDEESCQKAQRRLAGIGVDLFESIVPERLCERLHELSSEAQQHLGTAPTLQVIGDESLIPWEILKFPEIGGRGPFLAEAFALTRWLSGCVQELTLPLREVALVVTRSEELRTAQQEGEIVRSLTGRRIVELPARSTAILDHLSAGKADGLHFTGHGIVRGENPDRWSLQLEAGDELEAYDLKAGMSGFGGARPLIFANACHSARGGAGLTRTGGLASAFLKAGAGAYIGTHWAVRDDPACCFAAAFYKSFLEKGLPIGEAVRQARAKIREICPEDPTWLAYSVFAHPLARCRGIPESQPPAEPPPASPKTTTALRLETNPDNGEIASISTLFEPPIKRGPVPGEERVHEADGTVLVYIPEQEYTLGANDINDWTKPVYRVELSPFWIGKYPVTNEQYGRFLRANPHQSKPDFWDDATFNQPQQPVVGVSWFDACAYCQWAGLDLPTEAQWEAAARGQDQRRYPWGSEPPTAKYANYDSKNGKTTPVSAHPAGAGPYGTLDQAGNVWEWCVDTWVFTAYRQRDGMRDPVAIGDPAMRVVRGGAWINPAKDLRAAYRDRATARLRLNIQGFRCVAPSAPTRNC